MELKKRNESLDYIRGLAILSVILCHSVECVYYIFQDRNILYSMISPLSKIFDMTCLTIGRLGVPLFLFLTGILIGNKKFDSKESIKKYYKKNFLSLLITFEIWILLWNIFMICYCKFQDIQCTITIKSVLNNMLFMSTVDYILPAWYIPMILGVYLFLPFVTCILKQFDFKDIFFPLIVSIIYFFAIPTVNLILRLFNIEIYSNLDLLFSGGCYGIYIILGYYMSKGLLKKIKSVYLYVFSIISFCLCIALQLFMIENGTVYKLDYGNIFLLLGTCTLFELLTRTYKKNNFTSNISKLSFISLPLFLIHNLVQYVIYASNILSTFIRPINVLLNFTITIIISCIIVWFLKLNKFTRKYLLRL